MYRKYSIGKTNVVHIPLGILGTAYVCFWGLWRLKEWDKAAPRFRHTSSWSRFSILLLCYIIISHYQWIVSYFKPRYYDHFIDLPIITDYIEPWSIYPYSSSLIYIPSFLIESTLKQPQIQRGRQRSSHPTQQCHSPSGWRRLGQRWGTGLSGL